MTTPEPAPVDAEVEALRDALLSIAEHTNPDSVDNYRSDDREGCLDTVYAIAANAAASVSADSKPAGYQPQFNDGSWSNAIYTREERDKLRADCITAWRTLYASPRASEADIARLTASSPPARAATGAVEVKALPDDLLSHQSSWRGALVAMRDNAPPSREDFDDRGYWQHELDVFDRFYTALTASQAENAVLRAKRDEARVELDAAQANYILVREGLTKAAVRLAEANAYGDAEHARADAAEAQAAALQKRVVALELKARGADAVIAAIERAIPDWRSYRDLVDAVECKVARS